MVCLNTPRVVASTGSSASTGDKLRTGCKVIKSYSQLLWCNIWREWNLTVGGSSILQVQRRLGQRGRGVLFHDGDSSCKKDWKTAYVSNKNWFEWCTQQVTMLSTLSSSWGVLDEVQVTKAEKRNAAGLYSTLLTQKIVPIGWWWIQLGTSSALRLTCSHITF